MRHLRRRLNRGAATLAVLVLSVTITMAAKAAVDILHTDAAAAFKAGDYERAAREFAALVSENPGDVTLLRYLGITLRKLERYDDALTIFQKALSIAPDNVAVNYHAAVTIYKAGAVVEAVRSFKTVITLAPDSKYAELANQYLEAISDQLARAQQPTEPGRFGFYGQVGWTYDSNALAVPDGSGLSTGDTEGNRFSGYASGQYFFVNKERWLGTVDLSAYGAGYAEDRFSGSDIRQLNPGLSIQRTTQLGRYPAVYSARYDYLDVDLDGEAYSESNALTLMSRISFTPRTGTRLSYRYTRDDFEDEGFDPAFSSRDADNQAIELLNTWYLNDRKMELDLGASYTRNDADGVNFNYDAWQLETAVRFSLPRGWRLNFRATWASDEYPDFAGPEKRRTDITTVGVALRRWFRDKFLMELNAGWHDENSSYDSLTFDRYTAGLSFSYVY